MSNGKTAAPIDFRDVSSEFRGQNGRIENHVDSAIDYFRSTYERRNRRARRRHWLAGNENQSAGFPHPFAGRPNHGIHMRQDRRDLSEKLSYCLSHCCVENDKASSRRKNSVFSFATTS
jgi:hypothetical protein